MPFNELAARGLDVAVSPAGDDRPLDGIRILDLTRVVAGPHCTRMLAELGADVIKLEPPDGDQTRGAAAARGHPSPPGFVQLNLGKRLIAVDLGRAGGHRARAPAGRRRRRADRELPARRDAVVGTRLRRRWPPTTPTLDLRLDLRLRPDGRVARARGRTRPFVHGEAGYLHTAAQLKSAPIEHDPMSIADLAAAKDATIALLAALCSAAAPAGASTSTSRWPTRSSSSTSSPRRC